MPRAAKPAQEPRGASSRIERLGLFTRLFLSLSMSFIMPVLTFLLVVTIFNLMIIVHELGHFLAAKWRGLVIEEFGVWFGKPLWKKKFGGVWYSVGTLPFGGFVKLPQMAAMDAVEGESETPREELPPASPLSKIIVAFAGPLFSFLLAVFFALIVWQVGRPVTEQEKTTTIGYVAPDSPAAAAGLKAGDEIVSIDGEPVHRWSGMGKDSIKWRIVASEGDTLDVQVLRNGLPVEALPKPTVPATKFWNRKALREIGVNPRDTPVVGEVEKGGAAAEAGLEEGDHILALNGHPVYFLAAIAQNVDQEQGKPLVVTVERKGKNVDTRPMVLHDALVRDVLKGSPAEAANVKAGDRITAIDGQSYVSAKKFTDLIRGDGAKPVSLDLLRDGKPLHVSVTAGVLEGENVLRIGIELADDFGVKFDERGISKLDYPSPGEQIKKAATSIYDTVRAIASRKSGISLQHMSGPVMMIHAYWNFFQEQDGWRMALWFSVVLNVNLAILNMLPIPPLDGSHITLSIIEGVRRRPVNVRIVGFIQTACTIVIIGFMLYIVFFDVQDLFPSGHDLKFRPAAATPAQVEKP
jgi:regulator of sigma E protease